MSRWWARRAVVLAAAWAVLVGLLILCGKGVERSSAITSLDTRITNFVVAHRTPALNEIMKVVTWLGSWIATLVVALVAGALAWRRRVPVAAAIAALTAWIGELLAVTLTKSVVQRPRPPEALRLIVAHGWSFPSGHAANATVVFATAAALLTTFVRARGARVVAWVLAVLATALVAFSRIELGVHWTTDVVASAVWTTCWLLIVARTVLAPQPTAVTQDAGERFGIASIRRRARR